MKWQQTVAMVVSALGIMDTLILMPDAFSQQGTSCGPPEYFMGYLIDCGKVTSSAYSKIFGIPVSLLGFIYYITMFVLLMKAADIDFSAGDRISQMVIAASVIGFLFSVYFVYIQLFVLELICKYCMGSAATSTTLFAILFGSFVNKRLSS